MAQVSLRELLEAGVHFGHQTRRWNPKMRRFIFGERSGIHIIDLQRTEVLLDRAQQFAGNVAGRGGTVLFVGTKKQARDTVKDAAESCGMPYIHQRWLGGLLTNFQTVNMRIKRLHELTEWTESGQMELLPTRERIAAIKERDKLEYNLGGVRNMQRPPDAIFVVDLKTEAIALREAARLRIPVIGLVDTNCDPDPVDFVIPGNDDAIRSCKVIVEAIAGVVSEESGRFRAEEEAARKEAEDQARRRPRNSNARRPKRRPGARPRSRRARRPSRPPTPRGHPRARPPPPSPLRSPSSVCSIPARSPEMAAISATQVKELRERTGAGMMDSKNALVESDGDVEKAIELLRVKGQAKAAKRGDRSASEGLVVSYVHHNGKVGALVEVNCETDFVARNDEFTEFAREVASHVAASAVKYVSEDEVPEEDRDAELRVLKEQAAGEGKPEEVQQKIAEGRMRKWLEETVLLNQKHINEDKHDGKTIDELRAELSANTGENVVVRRFSRFRIGE